VKHSTVKNMSLSQSLSLWKRILVAEIAKSAAGVATGSSVSSSAASSASAASSSSLGRRNLIKNRESRCFSSPSSSSNKSPSSSNKSSWSGRSRSSSGTNNRGASGDVLAGIKLKAAADAAKADAAAWQLEHPLRKENASGIQRPKKKQSSADSADAGNHAHASNNSENSTKNGGKGGSSPWVKKSSDGYKLQGGAGRRSVVDMKEFTKAQTTLRHFFGPKVTRLVQFENLKELSPARSDDVVAFLIYRGGGEQRMKTHSRGSGVSRITAENANSSATAAFLVHPEKLRKKGIRPRVPNDGLLAFAMMEDIDARARALRFMNDVCTEFSPNMFNDGLISLARRTNDEGSASAMRRKTGKMVGEDERKDIMKFLRAVRAEFGVHVTSKESVLKLATLFAEKEVHRRKSAVVRENNLDKNVCDELPTGFSGTASAFKDGDLEGSDGAIAFLRRCRDIYGEKILAVDQLFRIAAFPLEKRNGVEDFLFNAVSLLLSYKTRTPVDKIVDTSDSKPVWDELPTGFPVSKLLRLSTQPEFVRASSLEFLKEAVSIWGSDMLTNSLVNLSMMEDFAERDLCMDYIVDVTDIFRSTKNNRSYNTVDDHYAFGRSLFTEQLVSMSMFSKEERAANMQFFIDVVALDDATKRHAKSIITVAFEGEAAKADTIKFIEEVRSRGWRFDAEWFQAAINLKKAEERDGIVRFVEALNIPSAQITGGFARFIIANQDDYSNEGVASEAADLAASQSIEVFDGVQKLQWQEKTKSFNKVNEEVQYLSAFLRRNFKWNVEINRKIIAQDQHVRNAVLEFAQAVGHRFERPIGYEGLWRVSAIAKSRDENRLRAAIAFIQKLADDFGTTDHAEDYDKSNAVLRGPMSHIWRLLLMKDLDSVYFYIQCKVGEDPHLELKETLVDEILNVIGVE
jgi:hypothetical protein